MKPRLTRLAAIFGFGLAVALGAAAGQAGEVAPKPIIDKTKGDCVLPADQMRREHMNILKHRRDETMYQGVRGGKQSLRACLDCHAVKGDDGKPVSISSPKHFCRVCHDYAAVKVDCWDCHISVPDKAAGHAALKFRAGSMRAETSGLKSYLEGGDK